MKNLLFATLAALTFVSTGLSQVIILISDFSADESIGTNGNSQWAYDKPGKYLETNTSNTHNDNLFGSIPRINITGALGFSLTAKIDPSDAFDLSAQNPGNFVVSASDFGVEKASANFNFFDFVSPTPVTVFRAFNSALVSDQIDQWSFVGNGSPSDLLTSITFTKFEAATVPEPSTFAFMLMAGAAIAAWQTKRAKQRA